MIRRKFLGFIITVLAIGVIGMFSFNSSFIRKIYYKIQNRLVPVSGPKPDNEREETSLPKEGIAISVETALNSRCTSDYDDNPHNFHWGMFDKNKILSKAQIEIIINYAKIPRFTDGKIEIKSEKNILTFLMDDSSITTLRDWMIVESGMQQQAVGLVCAALGAGYVFSTLGMDGTSMSDNIFATVQMKLDAMKPSYNGKYWSSDAPLETKPWKSGTLPDPNRQGTKPLTAALEELKTTKKDGRKISVNDLGQLLWATRGRTPHFYKSDPWGMTIPTYQGKNDISEIFLISNGNISKYVNWKDNRPTNSLEQVGKIDTKLLKLLESQYNQNNYFIVLNNNENVARSRCEIGYQLLNLLLQAHALNINYNSSLLNDNQKEIFKKIGINDPVALIIF